MLPCLSAHHLSPPASLPKTWKALVLSHELGTAAEMDPYMPEVLPPLRPLLLYGRAGGVEPKRQQQHAVYTCCRYPSEELFCASLVPASSAPA
jgi:hypothetical protein